MVVPKSLKSSCMFLKSFAVVKWSLTGCRSGLLNSALNFWSLLGENSEPLER